MMSSARERREAESRRRKAAPPRVRELRQEATATVLLANLTVQWLPKDGGASNHQFDKSNSVDGEESEEGSEEKEEAEPGGVLIHRDRRYSQVTGVSPCVRGFSGEPD